MKSIKEKQMMVKWAKALNEPIDATLLEEVANYERLQTDILKSVKENSINDLIEASKVAEEFVEKIKIEYPKPPTVEEVLEILQQETKEIEKVVEEESKEIEEEVVEEKKEDLISKSVEQISKEVKLEEKASFQQPNPPLVEKNLEAIQKKLKFLEQAIGKIAALGPGSGEVNLLKLDDVDTSAIGDGKYLRYNSSNQKMEFATVSGGGGASVTVSNVAPSSSTVGDLWWSSDEGQLYIYYDDYWIQAAESLVFAATSEQANTALLVAQAAYNQANIAFEAANTKITFSNQLEILANEFVTVAYTDGSTNESVFSAEQGQAFISVIESGTPGTRLKVESTKVVIDDTNGNGGPRNLEVYGDVLANVKVVTQLVQPLSGALLLKSNIAGTGDGAYLTLSGAANGITSLVADGTGPITLSTDTTYIGKTNDATLTTNLGDLILNTRGGTNSGVIRIYDQANGNILLDPNGTGVVVIDSNLEITGNVISNFRVDGTITSTGDMNGYAFNGRIGSITGTTINADYFPIFVSAISPDQYLEGHLGLKYNPSTGLLTANNFSGVAASANSAGYVTGYGRAFYRKNEIVSPFIASGTNYVIPWDNQDAFNISDFTHGSGVFTNTSTRTRRFNFQMTVAITATGSGYTETDIWFSLNGTFGNTNRRGQIAYTGVTSTSQLLSTSWTFTLAQNDTVRCYVWANDTYKIGHAAYGMGANNSCILEITEV